MAKFCRVVDSIKARFGIIISRRGTTGQGTTRYADREVLKVYEDRGIVVIVLDNSDIKYVENGGNLIERIRQKYEDVRLDQGSRPKRPRK